MAGKSAYNCQQPTANSQPRILYINYANEQYKFQQKFALMAAKKLGGFDATKAYSPESIDEDFRKANSAILSIKRGNGLWLWKPYIILKALDEIREGDYVFYCDSGAFFFSSVMPLIKSMGDNDIWVSNIAFIEEEWTKPEIFSQLGITDEGIKTSGQVQGGFFLARKSEKSCAFVREWLGLCSRPELIMPLEPGEYHGECIENREDQSLLSVLSKLRGIKAHKPPFIAPKYFRLFHPVMVLKNTVKRITGRYVPPKYTSPWGREPKRVKNVYDDIYSPCIYLHRIRRAGSVFSVIRQAAQGLGPRMTLKIIAGWIAGSFRRKNTLPNS